MKFSTYFKSDIAVLMYLALVKFALHAFTNGQYGYHADELYYMAAGERLAWGYTEFPPLVALIAHWSRGLLGDSLGAIRFFPAIAGAALVLLTGLMVRELGGGRFAQCLAAISLIIAPYYLFMQTILTMNAFEPLFWTLCAYLVILIVKYRRPRLWLLVGVMVGLGLLNKYSMLFFGFSLLVGWLITHRVREEDSRWIALAIVIAGFISLPNLLWQYQHDWPFLEHQAAAELYDKKPFLQTTIDLLVQPIFFMQPFTFPIWATGLYFYFRTRIGKPYRALGWSYVVLFGLFVLLKGKYYYLAPIYPLLLSPGALMVEQFIRPRLWMQYTVIATLIITTLPMLPMVLPVLPLPTLLRFSQTYDPVYILPNAMRQTLNGRQTPRHYALMLGWEELVAQVSTTYHQLPPNEQAETAILAWHYGTAGAIDFFGQDYGLPTVISGAHTFYFWGPGAYTGDRVISIGGDLTTLTQAFNQVEQVATITYAPHTGIPGDIPLYLCQDIKIPLQQSWNQFKAYFNHPYPPEGQQNPIR